MCTATNMVACCISHCGNSSGTCNFENKGITFHRFPQDPAMKLKWINATGKKDWRPTQYSRVCSQHFREEDFNIGNVKRRILYKSAVPTLNIWKLINTSVDNQDRSSPPSSPSEQCIASASCSSCNRIFAEPISAENPTSRVSDSPDNKALRAALQDRTSVIKQQRLKIKRLQSKIRRDHNKILYLKYIIKILGHNSGDQAANSDEGINSDDLGLNSEEAEDSDEQVRDSDDQVLDSEDEAFKKKEQEFKKEDEALKTKKRPRSGKKVKSENKV